MKSSFILISLLISTNVFAANLVTDPATTAANSVSPSASGVVALTVDNTASGSSGKTAVSIKNNGGEAEPALKVQSIDWDAVSGISNIGAGGYFHSNNFYGVMGESTAESSGWFSSNSSSNNAPTVLIVSIGGNADLLEIQDSGANPLVEVDKDGKLLGYKGVQVATSSAKPSCSASNRGLFWVVQGAAGVADQLQVCLKDAANSYSWVNK